MRSRLLFSSTLAVVLLGGASGASAGAVTDPANLRSGPGAAWPVIGQVPANGDVHILTCAQGNRKGWCKVTYQGQKGWIAANVLAQTGRWGVKVAPLQTRYSAQVRSQPFSSAGVVTVIPPQTIVNIGNCSKGWRGGWCRVTYEGKSGYIRQSLLGRVNTVVR